MITLIKCILDGVGNYSYIPRWVLIFDLISLFIVYVFILWQWGL